MNERQLAQAYAQAYTLFSQIYHDGLNDDLVALLNLDVPSEETHYGADYYQLLIHNVYPYETIFLGEDGLLGGRITETVSEFFREIGYRADTNESDDHISTELGAMSFLCLAELDAVEDEIPYQIQRLRQLQRRMLDDHILRWLPAFVIAIQQQDNSPFTDVARQSLELVYTHRQQLGENLIASNHMFTLPEAPNLLADEKTSLRDIASYLLTPTYTGFFLSVNDIKRIGSMFRLPHGFGNRQQMLTNLLRTAADYDLFPTIMEEFTALASTWQQAYESLELLPTAIKTAWVDCLQNTATTLNQITQMAQDQNIVLDEEELAMSVAQGQNMAACEIDRGTTNGNTC